MKFKYKGMGLFGMFCLVFALIISGCNLMLPGQKGTLVPTDPRKVPQTTLSQTPILTLTAAANPAGKDPGIKALPSPASSTSPAPIRGIFGASMLPVIGPEGGLNQIRTAGLQWTRVEIRWQLVEPAQNDLDWARNAGVEEQMRNAAQAGLKVVAILNDTPGWAVKPGYMCGVIRDDLVARFVNFASEAVARYSQPPYNVHYWEIFNEPDAANILGCWGNPNEPYYGGKVYGRMLSQVYPAMKAVDADAQVMVGGLLLDCDPVNPPEDPNRPGMKKDCAPAQFLEGILKAGAGNSFDGIAFHSYDYFGTEGMYSNFNWGSDRSKDGSSTLAKAAFLRSILKKYTLNGRFLMNTEFAIFCGRANQPDCDDFNESVETTKAYYMVQFAAAAVADGYQAAIWYASQGERNNSLLNTDLSPKPVYYAYQFVNQILGNAAFSRMVDLDPAFKIFEFSKNHQTIWILWTLDGKDHTLTIPKKPSAFYRILKDGQPSLESSSQKVRLSLEPVILLFN